MSHYYKYNLLTNRKLVLFVLFFLSGILFARQEIQINNIWLPGRYEQPVWHWYHTSEDDTLFATKDYDFTSWDYSFLKIERELEHGIQWYSARINLTDKPYDYDVMSIVLTDVVSAYEVYWDGELVGKSGVVGNSEKKEIPGVLYNTIRLKKVLTQPGFHNLSVRLSNYHTNIGNALGLVTMANSSVVHYHKSYRSSYLLFNAGTLLTAGLFCIAMFFSGRRNRYYLWLALYCFWGFFTGFYSTFALYSEVSSRFADIINFLYNYGRLISVFAFLIFVVYTYDIPKKIFVVPASIAVFLVVAVMIHTGTWLPYISLHDIVMIFALLLIIYAIKQKTVGSIPALIGVIIWKFLDYSHLIPVLDEYYMILSVAGQIAFMFCIIISITLKIQAQEKLLHDIQLRSSRLEVELLKKNIQPHFILNTLQSIINWIKKKPENAVNLINSLAEEFKMINQIFDQKFITLKKEVELCETHLKIMSLRLGADYKLVVAGLSADEFVPPMIFHTLIENALTHSFKTQESGTINLECIREDTTAKYIISNRGSRLKDIHEKDPKEIQEGMGIKYIKARLEESYPGKWNLYYKLKNDLWEVTILISG
jgi:hypothetical protein